MPNHRIISADSHMTEPMDLWETGLDKKFRHRAPKIVFDENSGPRPALLFVVEGTSSMPAAGGFAAGRSGEELAKFMAKGNYKEARPSGWDPAERLKDQSIDGISGEILYPTLGMQLFQMPDGELQRQCFKVYNNWLQNYCSYASDRLFGIGLVSLENVDYAIKDLTEIAKQGMYGAMIWSSPPKGNSYGNPDYDRFWAAASELQLPLTLHPITGKGAKAVGVSEFGNREFNHGILSSTAFHEIQETIAGFIFDGVLEKHPQLKIVSAEADVGWFPHLLHRMDHFHQKLSKMLPRKLSMKPSEYAHRQIWATFQDDPVGPATHRFFGENNYMWASDFPHSDSTFPESISWIDKNFENLPNDIKNKMVNENVSKLYNLKSVITV